MRVNAMPKVERDAALARAKRSRSEEDYRDLVVVINNLRAFARSKGGA